MIQYFKEDNGDYLSIETDSQPQHFMFEGRASCITGLVGSVCTTSISLDYLQNHCQLIDKTLVPSDWLQKLGYEGGE